MMDWKTTVLLMIAGIFGSLVRLTLNPEPSWQRWALRFFVGISCAVFLGGLIGHLMVKWFDLSGESEAWAIAAAGFITGTSSEQVLDFIMRRMESSHKHK